MRNPRRNRSARRLAVLGAIAALGVGALALPQASEARSRSDRSSEGRESIRERVRSEGAEGSEHDESDGASSSSRGSMTAVTGQVGARDSWKAGFTGEGVTVAVIDTGIVPLPELVADGKVLMRSREVEDHEEILTRARERAARLFS